MQARQRAGLEVNILVRWWEADWQMAAGCPQYIPASSDLARESMAASSNQLKMVESLNLQGMLEEAESRMQTFILD